MKLIYHQVTHKGADKYRAEKSIDEAIGSILLFGNKIIIGTGRGQIEQWRFHREEFKLVREHVYSYDQVFLFVFFSLVFCFLPCIPSFTVHRLLCRPENCGH